MELGINTKKQKISKFLMAKLSYIFNDTIALVVFASIVIKTTVFLNVIRSSGASKLKLSFKDIALSFSYKNVLFALILISIAFLFSKRTHALVLTIINFLYSALILSDLWYFRGFRDFLSIHNIEEAQGMDNLSGTVLAMLRPIDIIFIIDNVLIIILVVLLRKRYKEMKRERGIFSFIFFAPVVIILFLHLTLDYNGNDYKGPTLFKTQFLPSSTMATLSPLGYHFYDSVMYVKDNTPYRLNDNEKKQIEEWLDYKNEKLPANEYKGLFKGKNLIFIQVESLENFVINKEYNGQTITPNLNNLLKNSMYFSNFYEQVNGGNSADADLMVNTSVLPVRRGSTFFRFPGNEYNTIAKLLKEENYFTRSLHSSDGKIWNVHQGIENFGFDIRWDIHDFKTKEVFNMGVTDEFFFNTVSDLAGKEKEPFYYYTVTVSSHVPFRIPEEKREFKLGSELEGTHRGDYLQAISYADKYIGSFIDSLDKKGILDDTVVVIFGDHSGIHKYYPDEISKVEETEAWWKNDYKVPFIIYSKNYSGKEMQTIGAQVDIVPTIAYLMGIDEKKYENTSIGRNLLNTNKNYALLNDGRIIGKENLSEADIKHIEKTFDISDLVVRTNYFKDKK